MSTLAPIIALITVVTVVTVKPGVTPDAGVSGNPTAQCPGKKLVTKIGTRVFRTERFTPTKSIISIQGSNSAGHLRARIVLGNSVACDWNLTVRDAKYHIIQTLAPADFDNLSFRWSARVPGNSMILDLRRCKTGVTPDLKYDEYIEVPERATDTYYSSKIFNLPDYSHLYPPVVTPENIWQRHLGDFVGFMMGGYQSETWGCSGVMIRSDLFLTNWHCGRPDPSNLSIEDTWKPEIWQNTVIDLSWDDDANSREYYAVELVAKSRDLDYALLRVLPINNLGVARYAQINRGLLAANTQLIVVHHPLGLRKQVSTTKCQVVNANYPSWWDKAPATDFTHQCDTESGSSGAPVFNTQGELVGLHHQGFIYDDACQPDGFNKAVKIQKIIEDIRSQRQDIVIPGAN